MGSFNLFIDKSTSDLVLTEGKNLTTISAPNYYAQKIESRLKTFFGEWFLDYKFGVKYFTNILIKQKDISKVDAIIKQNILDTTGVIRIIDFKSEIDKATRIYTVTKLDVLVESGEVVSVEGVAI